MNTILSPVSQFVNLPSTRNFSLDGSSVSSQPFSLSDFTMILSSADSGMFFIRTRTWSDLSGTYGFLSNS